MSLTPRLALLLLGLHFVRTVHGKFPSCHFIWEIQRETRECHTQLQLQTEPGAGCRGEWNTALCWPSAAVGEVKTLPCPSPLLRLFGENGVLSRNCTESGWSDTYPVIAVACYSNNTDEPTEGQTGNRIIMREQKKDKLLEHHRVFRDAAQLRQCHVFQPLLENKQEFGIRKPKKPGAAGPLGCGKERHRWGRGLK